MLDTRNEADIQQSLGEGRRPTLNLQFRGSCPLGGWQIQDWCTPNHMCRPGRVTHIHAKFEIESRRETHHSLGWAMSDGQLCEMRRITIEQQLGEVEMSLPLGVQRG